MPFWLKSFYIVWLIGKTIFYIYLGYWLFSIRKEKPKPWAHWIFHTKIISAITYLFGVSFAAILVCIGLLYLTDVGNLLIGNYRFVEGSTQQIWHERKQMSEYVRVNGIKIEFPISSTLERGKYYRIKYLPTMGYGLEAKEIDK